MMKRAAQHAPRGQRRDSRGDRREQQGFTLLEVMIALVILMVAALGAGSLQAATTRANIDARNRTIATDFLRSWVERVKMDAMAWTDPATAAPNLILTNNANLDNTWFIPALALGGGAQSSADFFGWDGAVGPRYCANLRAVSLIPNDSIRVDIRVWWYRTGGTSQWDDVALTPGGTIESHYGLVVGCGTAATAPVADPRVHVLTASTVLKVGGM